MSRRVLFALAVLLACASLSFDRSNADPRDQQRLQSFYIARLFFSDYLPAWSDTILDVAPQHDDVRVRVVRISLANDFCPGVTVNAVERVFPHTSVRKFAGRDMCAFTPEGVAAALKAAATKGIIDPSDSATEAVVAKCGAKENKFDFPYPGGVDQKALERQNPAVLGLWDVYYRIYQRVLGKNFVFEDAPSEQQKQMQDLGSRLVPELISGKYQTAYAGSKCGDQDCDNYLAWQLRDYKGPTAPYNPAIVTLVDASSFRFSKYVAPVMPRMAQLASVYGDVRLRIFADPKTGSVTKVEVISGPRLLWRAATDAARLWQFVPGSLSSDTIEATLRFELQCH